MKKAKINCDTIYPVLIRELEKVQTSGTLIPLIESQLMLKETSAVWLYENLTFQDREDYWDSVKETLYSLLGKYDLTWVMNLEKITEYCNQFLDDLGFKEISYSIEDNDKHEVTEVIHLVNEKGFDVNKADHYTRLLLKSLIQPE